jgi:hypothetical protein
MIFSELVSVFKDEQDVLEQGMSEKRWSDFLDLFYDYDFLVLANHDQVLDKVVPDLLIQKLAGLSAQKFVFDAKNKVLTLQNGAGKNDGEALSMQAVLETYGDASLVSIAEKGLFKVA